MRLDSLVRFLDDYLRVTEEIADAPEAVNGLQVGNSGDVTRLAAAVDLCEATVRQATEQHADCLLVHHGMFWGGGGLRPLVGPAYRRIAGLIKGNIALYAAHLPLDRHPDVGNNSVLARMLNIKGRGDFGSYHGAPAGVWGEYHGTREELSWALTKALGTAPRLFPFGPERVQRVGIVTGAGGSLTRRRPRRVSIRSSPEKGSTGRFSTPKSLVSTCFSRVITPRRQLASRRWLSRSPGSSTCPGCFWIIPPGCEAPARPGRPGRRRAARDGSLVQCVRRCADPRPRLATFARHDRLADDLSPARIRRWRARECDLHAGRSFVRTAVGRRIGGTGRARNARRCGLERDR